MIFYIKKYGVLLLNNTPYIDIAVQHQFFMFMIVTFNLL